MVLRANRTNQLRAPVAAQVPVGLAGVCGTVAEPDGAGVVPLGVGFGLDVALGAGVRVGFLVFDGLGVGLGVVVCAGVTTTSGGGGGRTSR